MTLRLLLSVPFLQRISSPHIWAALFATVLGAALGLAPQPVSAQNASGGRGGGHAPTSVPRVSSPPVPRPITAPRVRIVTPQVPANGARLPRTFPPRVITGLVVHPFSAGFLSPGQRRFEGFGFGSFGPGFRPGFGFATLGCTPLWNFGCSLFGYYDYYLPYYGFGAPPKPSPAPTYSEPQPAPPGEYIIPYVLETPSGSQLEPEELKHAETVLYLKNGQVHLLTNYRVEDNTLHYRTADGSENTFNIDEIDVQKTTDVNASRGVSFTLHPKSE